MTSLLILFFLIRAMSKYVVTGGVPLSGTVSVSGSKNAVLPLIAASILTDEPVTLTNVPDISDVRDMAMIIEELGGHVTFGDHSITMETKVLKTTEITGPAAKKIRASILFLGSLLGRAGEAVSPLPGGDAIGKRPIDSHLKAFQDLGAEVSQEKDVLRVSAQELVGNRIRLVEMSVTGVENAILAAVKAKGMTEIRQAPFEPHVQDLCHMLNSMGAKITGIGTTTLYIDGVEKLSGVTHHVVPDYLETGTYVIAALVTKGHVIVENIDADHLDILWNYLDQMGVRYTLEKTRIEIFPTEKLHKVKRIRTAIYPDFPTDLIAPMAVLLTQCEGINKIFETLYEARLNYLIELEKMGAQCQIINAHEALIVGPTKLRGTSVTSWDLRAGTAMVLAGLAAEGETEVSEIKWIDRGYENLDGKLRALGAKIERIG